MAYVKVQNAVGKVFDGAAPAGGTDQFLKWLDGDFSIIGIGDSEDDEIKIENKPVNLDSYGPFAVAAGIVSQAQLNTLISQRDTAATAAAEAHEFQVYLRLKAKYEP